ncbi:CoA-binding protein [Geotalea sp. SG265]|uniref:CoA-binding protein n=1 Tax=Geotalea sp. SG265 TaxID=2922867 RepID=UPI001FAEAEF3|nr:CoA-binding protein [Geotalea sp. SG265]
MRKEMEEFFKAEAFGVVGASSDRGKYGNRVLRCYREHRLRAIPVNPREKEIEGEACVASVAELPPEVTSISVITPPAVTEKVVEEAAGKGIRNIWMQPGAESQAAIELCRKRGINVIGDGSCILITLGFSEH